MIALPLELSRLAGVRYLDNGRDAATGLDCWGFYREARRAMGLPVPPVNLIGKRSLRDAAFLDGMSSPEWRRTDSPARGMLALFRTRLGHHCGLMLDRAAFAHLSRLGLRVGVLDDLRWARIHLGVYEYVPKN